MFHCSCFSFSSPMFHDCFWPFHISILMEMHRIISSSNDSLNFFFSIFISDASWLLLTFPHFHFDGDAPDRQVISNDSLNFFSSIFISDVSWLFLTFPHFHLDGDAPDHKVIKWFVKLFLRCFRCFVVFQRDFHWDQNLEHEKVLGLHDKCCFVLLLLCWCHFFPYSSFWNRFRHQKNLLMLDYDIFWFLFMFDVFYMYIHWFNETEMIWCANHDFLIITLFFVCFCFIICVLYRSFSIIRVICDVYLIVWDCTSLVSTSLRRLSDCPCVDHYRALYVMFPSVVTRANRLGSVISWKYAVKTYKGQRLHAWL